MLEARGLTKRFGDHPALRGVDLEVRPGTATILFGPSGGGKTTLLRAMALLEPPDAGEVRVDDRVYTFPTGPGPQPPPWPRLTLVFQQLFLFPHMTLRGNFELVLRGRGPEGLRQAVELADRLDLTPVLDRYPNQVSIGQRQRAALVRGLALDPAYLLLDEVTSALDVETVLIVADLLIEAKARGVGLLVVTHSVGFGRKVGDRFAFIDRGRVAVAGTADEVLSAPTDARLRLFLEANGILTGSADPTRSVR